MHSNPRQLYLRITPLSHSKRWLAAGMKSSSKKKDNPGISCTNVHKNRRSLFKEIHKLQSNSDDQQTIITQGLSSATFVEPPFFFAQASLKWSFKTISKDGSQSGKRIKKSDCSKNTIKNLDHDGGVQWKSRGDYFHLGTSLVSLWETFSATHERFAAVAPYMTGARLLRQKPMRILPGIGPKVAACIALFSLDKHQAIPVDTHVWKIAVRYLTPELAGEHLTPKLHVVVSRTFVRKFGEYAGCGLKQFFSFLN